ncbi:MAG TPA: hypothetical protein VFV38_08865 [Ktedonobacteraceae bacterium]|nr:hypothetical protein [Ktedonobacteraceae bacterium]
MERGQEVMLEPDRHIDSALHVAIESMQEVVGRGGNQEVEEYARKTLATLRFFVRVLTDSSQMTREQQGQLRELVALLETNPASPTSRKTRRKTRKKP